MGMSLWIIVNYLLEFLTIRNLDLIQGDEE